MLLTSGELRARARRARRAQRMRHRAPRHRPLPPENAEVYALLAAASHWFMHQCTHQHARGLTRCDGRLREAQSGERWAREASVAHASDGREAVRSSSCAAQTHRDVHCASPPLTCMARATIGPHHEEPSDPLRARAAHVHPFRWRLTKTTSEIRKHPTTTHGNAGFFHTHTSK